MKLILATKLFKCMKNKFKIGLTTILLSGLFFTACETYPDEDAYVYEQLASVTAYDTSVQFKGTGKRFNTYAIGENVIYVGDNDTTLIPKNDPRVASFVSKIETKMEKYLGYQEITNGITNPDMGISITVLKLDNYIIDYYNPYWWDCGYYYFYWWDCGYYPYYPYYYPTIVGSYTTGTVFVNMIDLTSGSDKKDVVWSGVIRSLLTGTETDADVDSALEDCFSQTKAFN
jgi:hypothetical protein